MTDIVERLIGAQADYLDPAVREIASHALETITAKDAEIEALRAEVEFLKRDAEHSRKHREEILAANARMREALERAKGVFAYYARLHLDKGTEEGDSKALTNMNHAKEIDKALKGDTNGNT